MRVFRVKMALFLLAVIGEMSLRGKPHGLA